MSVPIVVGDIDRTHVGPVSDVLANAILALASGPMAAYDKNDTMIAMILPSTSVPGLTITVTRDAATFRTWENHPSRSSLALQTERHREVVGTSRTVVEHHLRQASWLLGLPSLTRPELEGLVSAAIQKIADKAALTMSSLWNTRMLVDVTVAGPYAPATVTVMVDGVIVDTPDEIRADVESIPAAVRIGLAGETGPVTIGSVRGIRTYDAEALMQISIRSRRAETELPR